jgi:hypothetical protein
MSFASFLAEHLETTPGPPEHLTHHRTPSDDAQSDVFGSHESSPRNGTMAGISPEREAPQAWLEQPQPRHEKLRRRTASEPAMAGGMRTSAGPPVFDTPAAPHHQHPAHAHMQTFSASLNGAPAFGTARQEPPRADSDWQLHVQNQTAAGPPAGFGQAPSADMMDMDENNRQVTARQQPV